MASTFDLTQFDTASGRRLKKGCGPCDPGAELTLIPELLYFGYTQPGALSDWQPFMIKNTGSVNVGVESIDMEGEYELYGTVPVLLVPGEIATFSVRFAPTGEGIRIGTLQVKASTAGEQPEVKLVGIGGQLASGTGTGGTGGTGGSVTWAYRYGGFAVEEILPNEILLDQTY